MKTRNYKTLKGLLSQAWGNEINYNDFKKGVFYHKKHGYQGFKLPEDEKMKGFEMMSNVIYSNGKNHVYKLANYCGRPFGILSRLTIYNKSYGFRASYTAGQDYPAEIRTIQKIFRE